MNCDSQHYEDSPYEQCVGWTLEPGATIQRAAIECDVAMERRKWRTMSLPKLANQQHWVGLYARHKQLWKSAKQDPILLIVWCLAWTRCDIRHTWLFERLRWDFNEFFTHIWMIGIPMEPYGIVRPLCPLIWLTTLSIFANHPCDTIRRLTSMIHFCSKQATLPFL